jgi:tRNA threonylcarbamoyladenosine biosynthesis protein TsaB
LIVLALDTCLGSLSVALRHRDAAGAWAVTGSSSQHDGRHAELLMPMIAEVLGSAGLGFASVERVAVTIGPGTFTGVRTGIAAARAFRLAAGVEVVGTTSLAVLAHRVYTTAPPGAGERVLVAADARRGMVYAQLFEASATDPVGPAVEVLPSDAVAMIGPRSALVVGSGAAAVLAAAADAGAAAYPGPAMADPSARDLLDLAGRLSPLADVRPVYIRAPDAKPQAATSLARAP